MRAVIVNALAVLLGSLLGIKLGGRFRENLRTSLVKALAICAFVIGIDSGLKSNDILCLIICMALGTGLGEWLNLEKCIQKMGDFFKKKLPVGKDDNSRFTEGFVASCALFCIGSMTIIGSLEAGVKGNFSIIYAKSALDFVSAVAFGAAMGWGVSCSALFILLFQGGLTLLAGVVGPYLSPDIVNEMTAAGGVILIAISINVLELGRKPIRGANMLPAVFLPILYVPISRYFI